MIQQLFRLAPGILKSASESEVNATYSDMEELGIEKLPFSDFTVELLVGEAFIVSRDGVPLTDESKTIHDKECWDKSPVHLVYKDSKFHLLSIKGGRCPLGLGKHIDILDAEEIIRRYQPGYSAEGFGESVRKLLVVLLATKNIIRETSHNPLARHGVGKEKALYTTTLHLGVVPQAEGQPSGQPGSPRRPHLRRGHIRRQKHGPGLTFEKAIFIQPVFVNGVPPEGTGRTAYNLSLG